MLKIKDWLDTKSDKKQFVPEDEIGTICKVARRICDDKIFSMGDSIQIKNMPTKRFLLYGFNVDRIHVKTIEFATAPITVIPTIVEINDIL